MTPPTVVAITSSVPCSVGDEVFVQDELTAALDRGVPLTVVPMRLRQRGPNEAAVASGLAGVAVAEPLASPAVLVGAARTLGRHPLRSVRAVAAALLASGGRRNLAVNLLIVVKALWVADLAVRRRATHLHAYWLSHTATAAMVASDITGIPWSATGYRWDIDAANALARKLRRARFLRCADELGRSQLEARAAATAGSCPVVMVRTGVDVPERASWAGTALQPLLLACPAMFVPKKGHTVLFEAVAALRPTHLDVRLDLFGGGPDEARLRAEVAALGLEGVVRFRGIAPLDELRGHLRRERPTCVLPSIRTSDGEEEGIPVTLIEAMACGAPVVSTRSGSIATLVVDGTGLLVEPGDPTALAAAIASVADDPAAAAARCDAAYDRLVGEYDLPHTAARMVELWSA